MICYLFYMVAIRKMYIPVKKVAIVSPQPSLAFIVHGHVGLTVINVHL